LPQYVAAQHTSGQLPAGHLSLVPCMVSWPMSKDEAPPTHAGGFSHLVRWDSAALPSFAASCVISCAVLLFVPFSRGILRPYS
jgi:hypothetical protein